MPGPRRKRSTRTQKPSFEIVRGGVEETQTGWVYRSDAEPVYRPEPEPRSIEPQPIEPAWPALRPVDRHRWERVEPEEPRREYSLAPSDALSPAIGMIEAGLMVMTFPVAMTAAMMFAPVLWMLNASRRR